MNAFQVMDWYRKEVIQFEYIKEWYKGFLCWHQVAFFTYLHHNSQSLIIIFVNWTQLLEFIYNLVIYQLAPANEMVQAILIMQGCQMTLPLGKVARYDITIYQRVVAQRIKGCFVSFSFWWTRVQFHAIRIR